MKHATDSLRVITISGMFLLAATLVCAPSIAAAQTTVAKAAPSPVERAASGDAPDDPGPLATDVSPAITHAAIRKAAAIRVRPVTMTALAAFFAMIPAALALERGSEANAPLARAILGGLIAGEPATLFVLPCLYSLMVKDKPGSREEPHDEEPAPEHV